MSDVMAWQWVVTALLVPFVVALAVAWPLWRRPSRDPMGSISAAFVAMVFAVAFVAREFIHIQKLTHQCIALDTSCHFSPEPWTRFFIYIAIAQAQVFAVFLIGWRLEDRRREEAVAPAWRR